MPTTTEAEMLERAREHMKIKVRIVAGPDGGPAREIPLRARKPIGRYVSRKMGRAMKWESFHERHLMWIAEADPQVVQYVEQPHKVVFRLKERLLRYTPDMLRVFADGRKEVIEVKRTRAEAEREPFYAEKLEVAREAYVHKNIKFRVLTADEDIEIEPLFANAKSIQADRFVRYETLDELKLREAISTGCGAIPYARAIETISETGSRYDVYARARVHSMIVARVASLDITMPIGPETLIGETPRAMASES